MAGRRGSGELTYAEVGATAGELPAGYAHLRRSRAIGQGRELFDRAGEAVLTWELQRRSGIAVEAPTGRIEVGTEARLRIRFGPLRFVAPVRVVYVVDEPDRIGFAYGTLPGHPESGEELFSVRYGEGGVVTVDVVAFSVPGRWFTRLGGPVVRRVQSLMTDRYLDALRW